jgi:hypothetical protein
MGSTLMCSPTWDQANYFDGNNEIVAIIGGYERGSRPIRTGHQEHTCDSDVLACNAIKAS